MGMNLTRAYTVHNKALCTIGRVQTPTLSMVVKRDAAIASFVKAYFYELVAQLEEGFAAKYCKDGQTRIDKKEEAERLHRQLSPNKVGTVRKIEKKVKRNRPPPLYDLNNLQRDANRCFGFTAAQTLERAQALYETHKLITYPRTESRHISEDMVPKLPGILEKLAHPQAAVALERLRGGHRLSRAYVDRTKLTDHHAIIPTGQQPAPNLAPDLQKVYDSGSGALCRHLPARPTGRGDDRLARHRRCRLCRQRVCRLRGGLDGRRHTASKRCKE